MKKIVLLTMHPFSAENRECFNEQVKGIISTQGMTGALVYSKDSPDDNKPYGYLYVGSSTKCAIEKCFENFYCNCGKIADDPSIDDIVIIESISMKTINTDVNRYSKEELAECIKASIEDTEDIQTIKAMYIEASIRIIFGLSDLIKELRFYFINIVDNFKYARDGKHLEVYDVFDRALKEVYASNTVYFDTPKIALCSD